MQIFKALSNDITLDGTWWNVYSENHAAGLFPCRLHSGMMGILHPELIGSALSQEGTKWLKLLTSWDVVLSGPGFLWSEYFAQWSSWSNRWCFSRNLTAHPNKCILAWLVRGPRWGPHIRIRSINLQQMCGQKTIDFGVWRDDMNLAMGKSTNAKSWKMMTKYMLKRHQHGGYVWLHCLKCRQQCTSNLNCHLPY